MSANLRLWCLLILWSVVPLPGASSADDPVRFQTGAPFRVAWNQSIRAQFNQISLRSVMEQLCSDRQIAWMADRRLDPDQLVSCPATEAPLSEFLSKLFQPIGADAVAVGSTIVVGPESSIRWLRTQVETQRLELRGTGVAATRIQALGRPLNLHWDDLAEPRDLLAQLVQSGKLKVEGGDAIPYDLWRKGDLAGVTAGEAVTLLAWQYDLRLNWTSSGDGKLVPRVKPEPLSRTVRLSVAQIEVASTRYPELKFEPSLTSAAVGKDLRVEGRLEDLESLEKWLKGASSKPRSPTNKPPKDWRKRKFLSYRIEEAPLLEVLNGLKEQGVPLDWDDEAMASAGVDLQTQVQADLKDPTLEQILDAICTPAQIRFEISAEGARLFPK